MNRYTHFRLNEDKQTYKDHLSGARISFYANAVMWLGLLPMAAIEILHSYWWLVVIIPFGSLVLLATGRDLLRTLFNYTELADYERQQIQQSVRSLEKKRRGR